MTRTSSGWPERDSSSSKRSAARSCWYAARACSGELSSWTYFDQEPPQLAELRARFERWSTGRSPERDQLWLNWAARDLDALVAQAGMERLGVLGADDLEVQAGVWRAQNVEGSTAGA